MAPKTSVNWYGDVGSGSTKGNSIHPALLLRTILTVLSVIILPISWIIFYRNRTHFVIKYRYTKLTIFASAAMLIVTVTLVMIGYFEHFFECNYYTQVCSLDESYSVPYNLIPAIGQSCGNVWCALIFLRTYWVYDRWVNTNYRLKNIDNIVQSSKAAKSVSAQQRNKELNFDLCGKSIKKVYVYYGFYLVILIVFILQTYWMHVRYIYMLVLNILAYLGCGLVGCWLIYKVRNVDEALNCSKETYATVIILFSQMLNANILKIMGFTKPWRYVVSTALSLVGAYAIIFIGLYLVYKNRTLKNKEASITMNSELRKQIENIDTTFDSSHKTIEITGTDFSAPNTQSKPLTPTSHNNVYTTSMIQNNNSIHDASELILTDIKKIGLHEMLSRNKEYYLLFANYLSQCFCLENLLFLVNAMTFRHVLLKILYRLNPELKSADDPFYLNNFNSTKALPIFSVTFDYIPEAYKKFDALKSEFVVKNNLNHIKIHESINAYINDIRDAFIKIYSIHEINISHDLRTRVEIVIQSKNDTLNNTDKNATEIVKEYISIYDECIMEVWYLVRSVYSNFRNQIH